MGLLIDKIKGPLMHGHKAADISGRYDYWTLRNGTKKVIKYGLLYNWYAAAYNANGASIAPAGWHVPSKDEYETLALYLDSDAIQSSNDVGAYIKESGFINWHTPNTGATNSTGFSARGSGTRDFNTGSFNSIQRICYLWNIESSGPIFGYVSVLEDNSAILYTDISNSGSLLQKIYGGSIRLIKDDSTNTGTVTDYDGNIYATVKIGNQVWMSENLAVTHYNDGTPIPEVTDNGAWAALTTGALCAYNNDWANVFAAVDSVNIENHNILELEAGNNIELTLTPDKKLSIAATVAGGAILELYADNETELLAAWSTAVASGKAARIFITNNITFTANRSFIQPYASPAILLEAIQRREFDFATYSVEFGNITIKNVDFVTAAGNAKYFDVNGGNITLEAVRWITDVRDIDANKKNIVITGAFTTGKISIKNFSHYTANSAYNAADLIQPFWIENQATISGSVPVQYVELLEMGAVYEFNRFSRVLLTSTVADCPYLVTGDESWFYALGQPLLAVDNIAATAQIYKKSSVDLLYIKNLDTTSPLIGLAAIDENYRIVGTINKLGQSGFFKDLAPGTYNIFYNNYPTLEYTIFCNIEEDGVNVFTGPIEPVSTGGFSATISANAITGSIWFIAQLSDSAIQLQE